MALPNLRERQRAMILDMLRRADGGGTSMEEDGNWRVLVFDRVGMEVLGPIIKVKELRDAGVTLHLNIESSRQAIPEVPAIYFCEPTAANIARIADDAKSALYSKFDINFIAQVSRETLESLASQLAGLPSISTIRVLDRTLSYVALGPDLFTLTGDSSFQKMHSSSATEADIEVLFSRVTLGLSHVFMTTDTVPVVAHVRSGPASQFADKLIRQFGDLMKERLISAPTSSNRPLLLVVDRSYDLAAPLHHPFTYRGLLADALGMSLNKVDVTLQGSKKTHELDPDNDGFWIENASKSFAEVSSSIEEALAAYKREYAALTATEGMPSDSSSADAVTKMIAVAPKMAERKRFIDAHTTIAFATLSEIKARELDAFHGVEEAMLRREDLDREAFVKLLKDTQGSSKATAEDRLRLLLIAKLLSEEQQAAFVDEQVGLVQGDASRLPALEFIKKLQSWAVPGSKSQQADSSAWAWGQSLSKNFAKAFTSADDATTLPLTRLVDTILDAQRPGSAASRDRGKALEAVVAQDPRTPGAQVDMSTAKFSSVVVFVLGGGCMAEYDNLQQNTRTAGSVVYGCTEMLSGDAFAAQLTALGNESSA